MVAATTAVVDLPVGYMQLQVRVSFMLAKLLCSRELSSASHLLRRARHYSTTQASQSAVDI